MSSPLVTIVGSINMDYMEVPDFQVGNHMMSSPELSELGGRAVNHAFLLSRAGVNTCIYGSTGRDENGNKLHQELTKLENCELHINTVPLKITGITFYVTEPKLQYFHIAGANEVDITRELKNNSDDLVKADCCIADLETRLENVQTAFTLSGALGRTVNVLEASFPARGVTHNLLSDTHVVILRRAEAERLLENDREYRDYARRFGSPGMGWIDDFYEFAECIIDKGPRCVIVNLVEARQKPGDSKVLEGCLWAVRNESGNGPRITIGRVPGIATNLPYPNSAHAAFAGTIAYEIAKQRHANVDERRNKFLEKQDWGTFCRRGLAAYVKAASKRGASDSMPTLDEIDSVYNAMQTGTRTIVSIDVVGSTTLQAQSNTKKWRSFKEELTDLVEGELYPYRPTAVQWAGDGFWVVFDGAYNAVNAALSVLEVLKNRKICGLPIECRIGINTGDVVVGADNGAIGLPASLAKRTEAAGAKNEVTITELTKSLLNQEDFHFDPIRDVPPTEEHKGEPTLHICSVRPKGSVSVVQKPARKPRLVFNRKPKTPKTSVDLPAEAVIVVKVDDPQANVQP
jgi:class 3 adenylate cyclase